LECGQILHTNPGMIRLAEKQRSQMKLDITEAHCPERVSPPSKTRYLPGFPSSLLFTFSALAATIAAAIAVL